MTKKNNGHLRSLFAALTLACVVTLSGCGGGGSASNSPNTDNPPPNDDTPTRTTTVINGNV